MLALITDREGPDSASRVMSFLRVDVTTLGSPSVTAALHVLVAALAGKRGQIANASLHTRTAKRILAGNRHALLETSACANEIGLCLLSGDFNRALTYSNQAMALARQSGAAHALAGVLTNLGNAFLARGDCDEAIDYLRRAAELLPQTGQRWAGVTESPRAFSRKEISLSAGDCSRLVNPGLVPETLAGYTYTRLRTTD